MNLLFPFGRRNNRRIVEAANAAGHNTYIIENLVNESDRNDLNDLIQPTKWFTYPSRYEMGIDRWKYNKSLKEEMRRIIQEYNIDVIFQSPGVDGILKIIAELNSEENLIGIDETFDDLYPKSTINDLMESFMNPSFSAVTYRIYNVDGDIKSEYESIVYPCICKPVNGTGGYGVYVINSEEELNWFFGPEKDLYFFSEVSSFYQDKLPDGQYKNYRCFSGGGDYMVQEFLTGDLISVAGVSIDGKIRVDLMYDILVTELPHRSEYSFQWPSIHNNFDLTTRLTSLLSEFSENFTLPNGPFMMDLIYDPDVRLSVVDFSPRLSSSASELAYHLSDGGNYQLQNSALSAQINNEFSHDCVFNTPTVTTVFPFPIGTVKELKLLDTSDVIVEVFCPVCVGDLINDLRNDTMVQSRGYATATGTTIWEAVNNWNSWFNNCKYEIEPFS